jgi:hypothetical protein
MSYQASPALCAFVRSMAPPHVADSNGPRNWDELQATIWRPFGAPLPVNPFGAESSIYGDIETNIAFRAWHDQLHLDLLADFGSAGEYVVALAHRRAARAAGLPESDVAALWADTWQTFNYARDHGGQFPTNPREFVAHCLESTL